MFQVHQDDDTQDLATAYTVVIISRNVINGVLTVPAER